MPPPKVSKKVDIDQIQLGKLAELCSSVEDVAAYFRMPVQTVKSCLKKNPMKTIWESGQARGRISLRRAQMQSALGGDRTMQIWLGKQILNQTDKVEQDVKQEQKWVVELPPAMTAEQWVAAYGKVGGPVVTSGAPALGKPRRPGRRPARVLNRDDLDEIEAEEEAVEKDT
jgi:hypothetical protein